jgi:hypothetical protein
MGHRQTTMHSYKKWSAGERSTGNRRYTVYFLPQSYNCLLDLFLPHAAFIMFNIFRCQLHCNSTSVMPSTSDLCITILCLILAYTLHFTCVSLFLIYSVNHRMQQTFLAGGLCDQGGRRGRDSQWSDFPAAWTADGTDVVCCRLRALPAATRESSV